MNFRKPNSPAAIAAVGAVALILGILVLYMTGCARNSDSVAAKNIFGDEKKADMRPACDEARAKVKDLNGQLNKLQGEIAAMKKSTDEKLAKITSSGNIYSKDYVQPEEKRGLEAEWQKLTGKLQNMQAKETELKAQIANAAAKRDRLCK
jgi:peptidoglycan hydrolase CwlO-like protein